MRTLDDLQGAFALLEREADEYAASHDEVLVSPADLITLSATPSRRRRRLRPALWVTAAAVAAALTAGALVVFGSAGDQHSSADGVDLPLTSAGLRVPFTIDPTLGVKAFEYHDSNGQFSANLVDGSHLYELVISAPGQGATKLQGARPVDINGVDGQLAQTTTQSAPANASTTTSSPPSDRPVTEKQWALQQALWALQQAVQEQASVQASSPAASALVSAAKTRVRQAQTALTEAEREAQAAEAEAEQQAQSASSRQETAQLLWRTPSGESALLQGLGTAVSADRLLALARAIRFGSPPSAATVLPTAISLASAPAGMRLLDVHVSLPVAGVTTQLRVTAVSWQTAAEYELTGVSKEEGVQISLNGVFDGQTTGFMVGPGTVVSASRVVVAGHSGYWSPSQSTLSLDMGNGAYLNIRPSGAWNANPKFSYAAIAAMAASVTVATNPEDVSTWFDASKALPLGS